MSDSAENLPALQFERDVGAWTDAVDLEELWDADGNMRLREDVFREKRAKREEKLRAQATKDIEALKPCLAIIRSRGTEIENQDHDITLKTAELTLLSNETLFTVWMYLDKARASKARDEMQDIVDGLTWDMRLYKRISWILTWEAAEQKVDNNRFRPWDTIGMMARKAEAQYCEKRMDDECTAWDKFKADENRKPDWDSWGVTFVALSCFDHNLDFVKFVAENSRIVARQLGKWEAGERCLDWSGSWDESIETLAMEPVAHEANVLANTAKRVIEEVNDDEVNDEEDQPPRKIPRI
jgi:hypothetical protein